MCTYTRFDVLCALVGLTLRRLSKHVRYSFRMCLPHLAQIAAEMFAPVGWHGCAPQTDLSPWHQWAQQRKLANLPSARHYRRRSPLHPSGFHPCSSHGPCPGSRSYLLARPRVEVFAAQQHRNSPCFHHCVGATRTKFRYRVSRQRVVYVYAHANKRQQIVHASPTAKKNTPWIYCLHLSVLIKCAQNANCSCYRRACVYASACMCVCVLLCANT